MHLNICENSCFLASSQSRRYCGAILAEVPTADAEGGGEHAGGGATPPSGDDGGEGAGGEGGNAGSGRGATDRAPAAEDQTMGGSSHPAAGEV